MRTRRTLGLVAATAMIAAAALPASSSAREKLPVPWTFTIEPQSEADPDPSPPGSNDFDCMRRKHRRQPVVLVHGLMATQGLNWQTISPYLANRGFCVFSLTYGQMDGVELPGGSYEPGGLQRMQRSARELRRFINRVLRRTGARKVDIVGHSEGSLMPNWYVKFLGGARRVDDYIGITTLWDGTNLALAGTLDQLGHALTGGEPVPVPVIDDFCHSCRQFLQGSKFLRKMSVGGIVARRVTYTNIVTRYDELVIPYTSGLMPEARQVTNVVLQDYCELDLADHVSVAADPVTAGFVHRALDPKRAPDPPCALVLPGIGALGYSGT